MVDYVPMIGPLPGKQWTPSNGTIGESFLSDWCSNCARDKSMREGEPLDECDDNEVCPIIGASFRGEAVEWRKLDNGDVVCLAHVAPGAPIPEPRCEQTADLFAAAALADTGKE